MERFGDCVGSLATPPTVRRPSATATGSGVPLTSSETSPTLTPDVASPVPPPPDVDAPHATPDAGDATPVVDKRFPRFVKARLEQKRAAGRKGALVKNAGWHSRKVHEREEESIAVMTAAGMKASEVGRAMNLGTSTVLDNLKRPELQEKLARWRDLFRAEALQKAQNIQGKAWALAESALDEGDAKSFDAVTRGISAMERVAASASGENKPASVNVAVGVQATLSPEEKAELMREFARTVEAERG